MSRVWTELFEYAHARAPAARRHRLALEALTCALTLQFTWTWAREIPRGQLFVLPLGAARWVDLSFMFRPGVSHVNAALITFGLALGALRKHRLGYPLAFVCLHLQYVARHSLGKAGHGSHLVGTAVLGLALGALLHDDAALSRSFAAGFTTFFAALGYGSAALCKLIATGPHWVLGQHLSLWITERSVDGLGKSGVLALNVVQETLLHAPVLAAATLSFGLLAEACAPLALVRRYRPYVFGALAVMHVGIWLSMDILFDANIALVLVLGFPWWACAGRHAASSDVTAQPRTEPGLART